MSLNGLDSLQVSEAYQSALAEAGGWFLLQYASRDAIEILTRGAGGLAEARGAIAQYSEKSPLYGFLLYRRRKVLIKYIPEGTSRLLQARVAVHFQAITEKFSPHDTIFPISAAEDLNDTALTAACSLHTAAPSSCSSSGSSRRRKLDEITEDAEEGQASADDTSSIARPTTAASTIPTILEPSSPNVKSQTKPETPEPSPVRASLDNRPTTPRAKTSVSQITAEGAVDSSNIGRSEPINADYMAALKNYEFLIQNGEEPRLSSQTARPSASDLYSSIYYDYKPKVKLGPRPRPSMDSGKRPHTSGTGSRAEARPVSTLPAGLRIALRKTDQKRPKSRDSSTVPSIAFPPPPPIPNIPELSLITPMRPTSSPASVRSLPTTAFRSSGMTPEKQRLMKAVELRKKQMNARKVEEANRAKEEDTSPLTPVVVVEPDLSAEKELPADLLHIKKEPKAEGSPSNVNGANAEGVPLPSTDHSKADSGVEIILDGQQEAEDHQSSASASSPTSAQTQDASDSPSTRPSSISEEDDPADSILGVKPVIFQDSEVATKEDTAVESDSQEILEKESIESTPTIVPEDGSPVPSIEVNPPALPSDESRENEQSEEKVENDASAQDENKNADVEVEATTPSVPKRKGTIEVREKRRALVEPIRIDLSLENSDAEYLSDDSFMEELQSAKFEQAKPVSVSKSPISPSFFARKSTTSLVNVPDRLSANPFTSGRLTPEQPAGDRTSTGSWFTRPNHENMVIAKKINVSSGISQRIKALAENSNRESSASLNPSPSPESASSIVAQRKSSFRTPPSGPSPTPKHVKRFSRSSFAAMTGASPERQSVVPPQDGVHTVYNVQQQHDKPESVQVTARIVRDPRTQKPNLTMPTETSPLELHQSPIIIDHQKAPVPPSPKVNLPRAEPTSPVPPSSPPSRDTSSNLPRSSSESSWRSLGRRMSEARSPTSAISVRSQSVNSFDSNDDKREDKKDKKDSRTTRLFKRMSSSISAASRKGIAQAMSPTLKEEDHEASLPSLREPPPAVQVGDLNVQFPDTLLWKRRWVEVDGMGNIVLTLSKANEHPRGITKRYHLSEFRAPYAPDQDRQELPNSVILDFLDGRTLQCACETYIAQAQVLQVLREAHDAWMAYGQ
ncbi:hypothetical protein AOQ84DRAFT_161439 [Glonium stellatum]|uniref:ADF-H domain-containing protein n=1 Tax=Glonium stellatum TaxID=574774 RepID=A0A8E2F7Y6_9PEZI|nr:hypothetical protein AOQ84DRAFT_161439 [Glonium stellatum]